MSDLIDRQKAIDAALTFIVEYCGAAFDEDMQKMLCERLGDIPSADPERKTGEWEVQPSTGEDRPFIWWKCSECGHVIFSETERDRREFHAFCGRCGADMRGDDE